MTTIEDYVAGADVRPARAVERIRRIVGSVVPDAEETISYRIPPSSTAKCLLYFATFKDHMNAYRTVGAEAPTDGTKGTFRFTEDDPVPEEVVTAIVSRGLELVDGRR